MDFILLAIIIVIGIICLVSVSYLYNAVAINSKYLFELSALVSRTFREYYKGQDIKPEVINNGIDLVWTGDVDGFFDEDNKMGFITIMTNEGTINSPIKDVKEADIIASKIIPVIYDYLQDRDSQL